MKNILKKLGVLGLIVAVLAPFIELPKVNAETCTKHLQNYMFLDANYFALNDSGKTFLEGYSSATTSGGYLTYTVFPYVFSNNTANSVKVNWIEENNFGGGTGTVSALSNYWTLAKKSKTTDTIYLEVQSSSYYAEDLNIGSVFINDTTHKNSTYADNAIIFHGVWSSFDKNGVPTNEKASNINYSYGADYSIQKVFSDNNKLNLITADVGTALLTTGSNGFKFGTSAYNDLTTTYFQDMVDNKWNNISVSSSYIPLSIKRTINYGTAGVEDTLNDFIYGYVADKVYVFTKTGKTNLNEINDSYTALKEYLANPTGTASTHVVTNTSWTEDDLDFNTGKAYYWPTVLTVEYQTCSVTGQWTVSYDDNVDDTSVTNLPNSQTENLGTNIKVSTEKPSRSGYVFKKWCETKDGSGKCYNPGDTVESPAESKTIPLYAQWGPSGTANNEKTGVVSYIIGFVAVGVIAGGIYLISKKKNLFQQI